MDFALRDGRIVRSWNPSSAHNFRVDWVALWKISRVQLADVSHCFLSLRETRRALAELLVQLGLQPGPVMGLENS